MLVLPVSFTKEVWLQQNAFLSGDAISKEVIAGKGISNDTDRVDEDDLTSDGPHKPAKVSGMTDEGERTVSDELMLIAL